MSQALVSKHGSAVVAIGILLPEVIVRAGPRSVERFLEFFTVTIRNVNTRIAYAHAVGSFCRWLEERNIELREVRPMTVAAYIEHFPGSVPSCKQALAAIRMMCDWMVTGQILPTNPAASVRGPKHIVKRGKTPVLDADQARQLIDAIDVETIAGLRDRALIGVSTSMLISPRPACSAKRAARSFARSIGIGNSPIPACNGPRSWR